LIFEKNRHTSVGSAVTTIACLGWGSLVWDPRTLPIRRKKWFTDGPLVRVEFLRQSSDGRLTIVLDDGSPPVRALWTIMDANDLAQARGQLQTREGCPRLDGIGSWPGDDAKGPASIVDLPKWAADRGLSGVVWTALAPRFRETAGAKPTAEEVIAYLKSLRGTQRDEAERYIRRAPRQIDTPYRRLIEAELQWTPLNQ
jgi:hypothetical protein